MLVFGHLAHHNAQAGAQFANLTDLSTTSSSAPWCCKKLVKVQTCSTWLAKPAATHSSGGLDTATAQGGHLGFGDVASALTQTWCTCLFLSSRSTFEIGVLMNDAKNAKKGMLGAILLLHGHF